MAKDAELERLKAAQDAAFQRQQSAYETQQRAWSRRAEAQAELNRAFSAKQAAYDVQQRAWDAYLSIKRINGPMIDSLNSDQERAYQQMKSCFDSASRAYEAGDGASAKMYSEQGHAHKAESRCCVEKRRVLVAEIRSARDRHEATRPDFKRAKDEYTRAKRAYESAKSEHESARTSFKRAKAEHEAAKRAFKDRLEKIKAENKRRLDRRQSKDRDLAIKAGVPSMYLDSLLIKTDGSGNTNIYFGGFGSPDGPGHGHFVLDSSGTVTYRRNPHEAHGSQNYQDDRSGARTLYDRRIRSDQTPVGVGTQDIKTGDQSDIFYDRTSGDVGLHVTQYYSDNYRVSWDAGPGSSEQPHWTNQSHRKKSSRRHTPPPDTR